MESKIHKLERMVTLETTGPTLVVVWSLLQGSVAHGLDYDLQLVHPGTMLPAVRKLDLMIKRLVEVMLDCAVEESHWKQMMMAPKAGGCGLPSIESKSAAYFCAATMRLIPLILEEQAQKGTSLQAKIFDRVVVAQAELEALEAAHEFYMDAGLQVQEGSRSVHNKLELCALLAQFGTEAGHKLVGKIMTAADKATM